MDILRHMRKHAAAIRECGVHRSTRYRAYGFAATSKPRARKAKETDAAATANLPSAQAMSDHALMIQQRERMEAESRLRQQIARRENTER